MSPQMAPPPGEPWTQRDAQVARYAFVCGAQHMARFKEYADADVQAEARIRYPYPRVTRPLRVTLSDGTTWGMRGAEDTWNGPDKAEAPFAGYLSDKSGSYVCSRMDDLRRSLRTLEDVALIARVIAGETEEVDADA